MFQNSIKDTKAIFKINTSKEHYYIHFACIKTNPRAGFAKYVINTILIVTYKVFAT